MAVTISGDGTTTGVSGLFVNTTTKQYDPSAHYIITGAEYFSDSSLTYTPVHSDSIVIATISTRVRAVRADTSDNDMRVYVSYGYINSGGSNTMLSPENLPYSSVLGHVNDSSVSGIGWYGVLTEQHKLERDTVGNVNPVIYINSDLDGGIDGELLNITINYVEITQ